MIDEILEIKAEHMAFTEVNGRMLKKFDKIDVGVMRQAENLHANTVVLFRTLVEEFKDTFLSDLKTWRKRNSDLEQKYEYLSEWSSKFSSISLNLKEEMFRGQDRTKSNFNKVVDYIGM